MVLSGKTTHPYRGGAVSRSTALLLLTLALACSSGRPLPPAGSSGPVTLNIGFPNVTGEDPLRGIQQAARLISREGLVSLNRDGHASPRLAQGWTSSPDGMRWTIELRPNAQFHDGSPVNSSAVKDSLERSLASDDRDLSPGLADISDIETPNPHELVIRVRNRSTFLLDDLTVPILKIRTDGPPLGTGPYVMSPPSEGKIAMEAFKNYYRGAPRINRVVWKPYPTVRTAWAAMMRGDVDFLYEVGPDARGFVQGESSTKVFPFLRNYAYAVAFNIRKAPFGDRRVRKAMNFAIDRAAIVQQAFQGHARETSVPAWPEHWAFDPDVPSYPYDPARAMALLETTLPRNQLDTTTDRPPARFHFVCLLPESVALWERIGLLVQRNLSEIGIDMQLEAVPADQFSQRIGKGDFDAVLLELIVGNSASRPFFFWYSGSRLNAWGYKSPALDSALDGIRHAANDTEYRKAFRAFQVESIDDAPAIFLALGETSRAVSKRFEVIAPANTDILPTIGDWRLAGGPDGTTH
jgi:peptide/nickel transport system substrate-binding protein